MLTFFYVYLWARAVGKVFGIEPPLPGYSVEVLQWEVPVSLDGRTATLNGTVQQVYQQLLKINPNYEAEFGTIKDEFVPAITGTRKTSGALEKQDTWSDCGHFDPARAEAIWEGINHLNHVSGRPVSSPGPGVCGRVSCSYNSAIWWCNDASRKPVQLVTRSTTTKSFHNLMVQLLLHLAFRFDR